ncbi:MAG: class I SAM-dependent methyltransferase [Negativicutes bacterium]|nr:class I SAM-dependent methyltransferase [Negativicutes bacterium]
MKNERNKNRNSRAKAAPTYRKPISTGKRGGGSDGNQHQNASSALKHGEDSFAKRPYGAKPATFTEENAAENKSPIKKHSAPFKVQRSEGGYAKKPYGEKPIVSRSEGGSERKAAFPSGQFKETARSGRVRKLYPVRVQPKKLIRPAQPALQPEMPVSTDWQDVAGWYNSLVGQQGSEYHQRVILPGVERMLKETGGSFEETKILDLACGQGVLCRRLAGAGARVTGVDLAADLLELAKTYQREGVKQVTYLQGDVTNLIDENGRLRLGLQAGSFDAVTSVLSIQNMSPLSAVWQATYQLLKPGGVLIVVMMHPCFRIPQRSDWQWQQKDQRQVRTLWSYLSSEELRISAHPGQEAAGAESASTIHFHRPLQAYINTLGNAGLLVEHCEEWVSHKKEQESAKKAALDQARSEFPMFLALRCRKIGV